jgi:hypothetical protein
MRALRLTVGFVGLCGLALVAFAEHRPSLQWMAGYTSVDHAGCCSEVDCVPAEVSLLRHEAGQVLVLINGREVLLPRASVHQSEDGQAYWCMRVHHLPPTTENTRCVFYVVGA